jgi:hypothetical protein
MSSSTKYVVLSAVLLSASVAKAHGPDPGGSSTANLDNSVDTTAAPDRIARIAARFKGSFILWDNSVSPETIDAQAQLSPIPSYQWWFSFRPRFYFTPKLSIRARLDLTVEWLNAVDTTLVREPTIGDLWVDVAYNLPTALKDRLASTIALRSIWGTSKESMGQTMVAKLGVSIGEVLTLPLKKGGTFELSLGMYALHAFDQSSTPQAVNGKSFGCTSSADELPVTCGQYSGLENVQWSLTALPSIKYSPHPQWSIQLTYAVLDSWAAQTANATDANGRPIPRSANDTRFRQSGWFLASVDYDPKDWLEFSLGYYCLRPILDPDGKYGNPFWEAGGTSRIFLTTTFNLDKVGESIARRVKSQRAAAEEKKRNLAATPASTGASISF